MRLQPKKGALIQNHCVRSFAGCADLNLAGLLCLVPHVQRQWRFSPANQWSAEFTRHVLVTVRFAWNLVRGGTKKSTRYQVLYPVENPPKVNRTEPNRTVPYHAVENCRTAFVSENKWFILLCRVINYWGTVSKMSTKFKILLQKKCLRV